MPRQAILRGRQSRLRRLAGLLAFAALLGAAAPIRSGEANVVYVTDELRLGLHRTEETSGRAIKTLVSGTRLDILERSLMSIRVRTEDGDEGWVKTAFVVDKEPARRRLGRAEDELGNARSQLAEGEAEQRKLAGQLEELSAALAEARLGVDDLPALRSENASLKQALASTGSRIPVPWVAAAVTIALIAGFIAGYGWLDRRVRKQFGGLKLY